MEKSYISSDSLIEFEFLTNQEIKLHYHENIELLFLLKGALSVTVEEESFQMEAGDFVVVNANRNHSYESDADVLISRFVLAYSKISELMNSNSILFWCNSVLDANKAYDEVRYVISRIFNQYLKAEKSRGNEKIYLYSLYYQLLHILVENFLVTEKGVRIVTDGHSNDDRMREIFDYIRVNYRHSISLQDLAEQLYLSPAYISKYIKRKCKNSFMDLVSSVRLGHAIEDLIHTENSVIKIAMDNGFASVAAFNKVFKDAYEETPSEFRREKRKRKTTDKKLEEVQKEKINHEVEAFLEQIPADEALEEACPNEMDGSGDTTSYCGSWHNFCGKMINAGTALDLIKSSFQEQIVLMKERLGFEYVRFWDIYNPELFIDIHADKVHMHFGQLDTVTDFLVKNNLKPYMELGFKPIKLLKNTQDALKEIPRDQKFESDQEMGDFYSALIHHFIKRYGYEEVKKWYFEYWEKEGTSFRNLSYEFTPMEESGHQGYFHRFDILARTMKTALPEIHIGGGGFPLQHYGGKEFAKMLTLWKKHEELPDFISLNCYPYQQKKEGSIYYEKRITDLDFVKHNIDIAKEAAKEAEFPIKNIHVTEYSMSLSNRNAMNDSCAKAAFLMQNILSCTGKTEMMSHWLFTDIYADFQDSQNLLFGGCGILTKNGIPKPGFYVFEFCNHLYRKIIMKEEHYLVTENDRGSFRIICHNYKGFNYNYYMSPEDKIQVEDIPGMVENKDHLTIHFKIAHAHNGTYIVRQNRINQQNGSIQDECKQLNMESELAMDEMEYLKKIIAAKLTIQQIEVENNCLEFDVQLEANEIQHLYISRK